jgi:hypothetical protein
MPIKVVCPQCNKSLNAPDGAAGRTATCPKCKGQIRIPGTPVAKTSPPHATNGATPATPKRSPVVKVDVPVASVASAGPKPLVAKALKSKGGPERRDASPSLDPLPALDPLGDADPFAGLSIEALGGDPLAGAALASSPLAVAPTRRLNIDLLPLLVIAGGILIVSLLAGGVYLVMRSWGTNVDWLKFMPDEAQMIARVDVQAVRASGLYEKMKQVNPAMEEQIQQGLRGTSLRLEDIAAVSLGGSFQDREKFVAVVQTNRSVSEDEVRGAKTTRQENVGDYTLHFADKYAGARIDDNTVVSGSPEMVKAVLSRNGPARFSPALQAAVDDAGFSSDVTLVMTLQGLPGMNRAVPGAPIDPRQVESLAVSADLGSSIELEATVFFQDASTASALKEKIDEQMSGMRQMMGKMPPQAQGFTEVLDSLSISRSGRKIIASVSIPQALIEQATSGIKPPALPAAGTTRNGPDKVQERPGRGPSRTRPWRQDPSLPPGRGLF